MTINIESINQFEDLKNKGFVLLDFSADWCNPCKMLGMVLSDIEKEIPGLVILKINVDSFHEIASDYMITSLPTIQLYLNGEFLKEHVGYMNKIQLLSMIKSSI